MINNTAITLPECLDCQHYEGSRTCKAFPGEIPLPIWDDSRDHRTPYPGDNGILFKPVKKEATQDNK